MAPFHYMVRMIAVRTVIQKYTKSQLSILLKHFAFTQKRKCMFL